MSISRSKKSLAIANLLVFCIMVYVNYLANNLPINGVRTEQISNSFPNLFVPSSFTFAIWILIYLLLFSFVGYQLYVTFRAEPSTSTFVDRIGVLFIISCLANIGWIVSWHYFRPDLSLMMVSGLLLSTLAIYLRLGVSIKQKLPKMEKVFVHSTFSIYAGWTTVAACGNITVLLVARNWDQFGMSDQFWATVLVLLISLITMVLFLTRKDYAFTSVIVWALAGIILKRTTMDLEPDNAVIWGASIGAGLLTILMIVYSMNPPSVTEDEGGSP